MKPRSSKMQPAMLTQSLAGPGRAKSANSQSPGPREALRSVCALEHTEVSLADPWTQRLKGEARSHSAPFLHFTVRER